MVQKECSLIVCLFHTLNDTHNAEKEVYIIGYQYESHNIIISVLHVSITETLLQQKFIII